MIRSFIVLFPSLSLFSFPNLFLFSSLFSLYTSSSLSISPFLLFAPRRKDQKKVTAKDSTQNNSRNGITGSTPFVADHPSTSNNQIKINDLKFELERYRQPIHSITENRQVKFKKLLVAGTMAGIETNDIVVYIGHPS